MKSKEQDKIVEIEDYVIAAETDKAFGLWDGEAYNNRGGKKLVWVPKSLAKYVDCVLYLPEWLAIKSGLV